MEILEDREGWLAAYREGWLAHYQQTGETNWKIYNRPKNSVAPSGKAIDLSVSRLMLITSAGSYLRDSQEPFDAANVFGDYTIRLYPSSTPFAALDYAHDHYDHTAVLEDAQVLIPLRHLEALVSEGTIGELAPTVVSFSGYQPDVTRTLDELIPAITDVATKEQIDAAFLVPS